MSIVGELTGELECEHTFVFTDWPESLTQRSFEVTSWFRSLAKND